MSRHVEPWIKDTILGVNPECLSSRRDGELCQLLRWLNERDLANPVQEIYALVHDRDLEVTVRIPPEVAAEYEYSTPIERITTTRTPCLINIPEVSIDVSPDGVLFLVAHKIKLLGGQGDNAFGTPTPYKRSTEVMGWIRQLKASNLHEHQPQPALKQVAHNSAPTHEIEPPQTVQKFTQRAANASLKDIKKMNKLDDPRPQQAASIIHPIHSQYLYKLQNRSRLSIPILRGAPSPQSALFINETFVGGATVGCQAKQSLAKTIQEVKDDETANWDGPLLSQVSFRASELSDDDGSADRNNTQCIAHAVDVASQGDGESDAELEGSWGHPTPRKLKKSVLLTDDSEQGGHDLPTWPTSQRPSRSVISDRGLVSAASDSDGLATENDLASSARVIDAEDGPDHRAQVVPSTPNTSLEHLVGLEESKSQIPCGKNDRSSRSPHTPSRQGALIPLSSAQSPSPMPHSGFRKPSTSLFHSPSPRALAIDPGPRPTRSRPSQILVPNSDRSSQSLQPLSQSLSQRTELASQIQSRLVATSPDLFSSERHSASQKRRRPSRSSLTDISPRSRDDDGDVAMKLDNPPSLKHTSASSPHSSNSPTILSPSVSGPNVATVYQRSGAGRSSVFERAAKGESGLRAGKVRQKRRATPSNGENPTKRQPIFVPVRSAPAENIAKLEARRDIQKLQPVSIPSSKSSPPNEEAYCGALPRKRVASARKLVHHPSLGARDIDSSVHHPPTSQISNGHHVYANTSDHRAVDRSASAARVETHPRSRQASTSALSHIDAPRSLNNAKSIAPKQSSKLDDNVFRRDHSPTYNIKNIKRKLSDTDSSEGQRKPKLRIVSSDSIDINPVSASNVRQPQIKNPTSTPSHQAPRFSLHHSIGLSPASVSSLSKVSSIAQAEDAYHLDKRRASLANVPSLNLKKPPKSHSRHSLSASTSAILTSDVESRFRALVRAGIDKYDSKPDDQGGNVRLPPGKSRNGGEERLVGASHRRLVSDEGVGPSAGAASNIVARPLPDAVVGRVFPDQHSRVLHQYSEMQAQRSPSVSAGSFKAMFRRGLLTLEDCERLKEMAQRLRSVHPR